MISFPFFQDKIACFHFLRDYHSKTSKRPLRLYVYDLFIFGEFFWLIQQMKWYQGRLNFEKPIS